MKKMLYFFLCALKLKKLLNLPNIAFIISVFVLSDLTASPGFFIPDKTLSEFTSSSEVQQQTITGTIRDSQTGQAMPGVNIIVGGTTMGTISDANGKYSISAGKDAILVFTFIGYTESRIPVAGKTVIDVELVSELTALDEVVVVGYGTMKKSNISGSITSVKGGELRKMPTSNAAQALQGKAPVFVSRNEGQPGAETTILLRGVGSLRNSSPLWVVDGVKSAPLENVNDIESIEILKDAASTAIYGVEGANGVILVTTSKARMGKARVNYNVYLKSLNVKMPYTMLSTPQYIERYMQRWRDNNPTISDPTGKVKNMYLWSQSEIADLPSTNWVDVMTDPGFEQVHTLSVSGGTDQLGYNISLLHEYDKGTWVKTMFSKENVKFDFTQKIAEWLKFGESLNYTFSKTSDFQEWSQTYRATPIMKPRVGPGEEDNPLGTGYGYISEAFFPNIEWQGWNPLERAELTHNWKKNERMWGNFDIEVTPLKGLVWTTNLSGAMRNYWYEQFVDDNWGGIYINQAAYTRGKQGYWNQMDFEKVNYRNYLVNSYIAYSGQVGKHEYSIMGGTEVWANENNGSNGFATYGIPSQDLRVVTMGTSYYATNTLGDDSGLSQFGRLTYAYGGKYLFTATARNDASSRFAPGKRQAFFPAASVAWNLAKEFKLSGINDLKLRFGYGMSGNADVPANLWRQEYYQSVAGGPWVASRVVNKDITWEKTKTTNLGLDIGAWGSSLTATIDVYQKLTTDALIQVEIPATTGFSNYYTNAGEIKNSGVELTLGVNKVINKLTLAVNGNLGYNKNKVVSIGDAAYLTGGTYTRTYAGYPVSTFYGYVANGLITSQAQLDALNEGAVAQGFASWDGSATGPGDILYVDNDKNGTITGNDQAIIGNPWPALVYGININASFRGFDLLMNWQGVGNLDVYNYELLYIYNLYSDYNSTTKTLEAWSVDNPSATIPRLGNGAHNFQRVNSYLVEDASYLKLKNVQVGYTLNKNLITKMKMQNLRIYLGMENALTFTKFRGYDPEFIGGSSNYARGVYDANVYPMAISFLFGVQLGL
jgi:TonB-linked SusC/RagA family outer membrane protein